MCDLAGCSHDLFAVIFVASSPCYWTGMVQKTCLQLIPSVDLALGTPPELNALTGCQCYGEVRPFGYHHCNVLSLRVDLFLTWSCAWCCNKMELVHPGLPTMLLLEVAGEGCRWSWFCCAGGPVAEDFLRSFPALSSRITAGKHLGLNSEAAKCSVFWMLK